MGLTLLGAIFSLVRMISAYSLRGAFSQKSESFVANDDAPGKKEEGGRERGKGRKERRKLFPWEVKTSGLQLGRKSQATEITYFQASLWSRLSTDS